MAKRETQMSTTSASLESRNGRAAMKHVLEKLCVILSNAEQQVGTWTLFPSHLLCTVVTKGSIIRHSS